MKVFVDSKVTPFLKGLEASEKEIVDEFITLFEEHGFSLYPPILKKLSGHKLWELRPNNTRLLLGKISDGSIIVLGFHKDSRKTPKRHIELAKKRLKQWQKQKK